MLKGWYLSNGWLNGWFVSEEKKAVTPHISHTCGCEEGVFGQTERGRQRERERCMMSYSLTVFCRPISLCFWPISYQSWPRCSIPDISYSRCDGHEPESRPEQLLDIVWYRTYSGWNRVSVTPGQRKISCTLRSVYAYHDLWTILYWKNVNFKVLRPLLRTRKAKLAERLSVVMRWSERWSTLLI